MGAPITDRGPVNGTGEETSNPTILRLTVFLGEDRDIKVISRVGTRSLELADKTHIEDPILEIVLGDSKNEQRTGNLQTLPSLTAFESDIKAEHTRYKAYCEAVKSGSILWTYSVDQATVDARWTQVIRELPSEKPVPFSPRRLGQPFVVGS